MQGEGCGFGACSHGRWGGRPRQNCRWPPRPGNNAHRGKRDPASREGSLNAPTQKPQPGPSAAASDRPLALSHPRGYRGWTPVNRFRVRHIRLRLRVVELSFRGSPDATSARM